MADWINNLKNEDEKELLKEQERTKIWNQFPLIIKILQQLAKQTAAQVNEQLFDGKDKVKIIIKKPDYGDSKRINDFCVAIDSVPRKEDRSPDEKYSFAFLYVRYDYEKICISRVLETVENSATKKERRYFQTLPPLQLSSNENDFPFIHMNEQLLNQNEIARTLVEPVVRAYHGE